MNVPQIVRPLLPAEILSAAVRRAVVVGLVALFLFSVPSWAYVVFFKDGSQIVTKETYTIEGDKAILTLPSGTQAFYDASQIDAKKTAEYNKVDYGTATLIAGKNSEQLAKDARLDEKVTLGDLFSQRSGGLSLPEPQRRPDRNANAGAANSDSANPLTSAGYVDLMRLPRNPYPKPTIMAEMINYLKGQGIDNIRVFAGSEKTHPFLEIVAASEASVFKALKDSANGLVQIHERFPDDVTAFELLLLTDSQVRAGQFLLTLDLANVLVTGQIDPPNFFLRYVEF